MATSPANGNFLPNLATLSQFTSTDLTSETSEFITNIPETQQLWFTILYVFVWSCVQASLCHWLPGAVRRSSRCQPPEEVNIVHKTLFHSFFLLRALPCWSISQVLQAATKPQVDFYFKQGRIWLHWITARKLVQLSSSIYNCICLVTLFPDRRCSSNISLTLKTVAQPSRSVFHRQEAACFQVFFASNYLKSKQRFC